ncbi:MAG TPA: linear amide C-N hydrolase [Verrucomicrobiae bacterium]|jgi:hypothetical protein|nr:linear amide C-N hydrolase [Verrucomicrobiae bacterium]
MKLTVKTALSPAAISILSCVALLLSTIASRACTVFCDSQGDTVFAGRSFDIPDDPNLGLLLVPASAKAHGWISGGRFGSPWADGMNDQGLFVAVADVPTPHVTISSRQPADLQTFLNGLLGNCASVNEAISWCKKQPTPCLDADSVHSKGYYTFNTPEHILVADRSGDSVVLEWYEGKLKMTRKTGRYQLMTNFLLSDPKAGNYPCPRYMADSKIFEGAAGPSMQTSRQVLETTSDGFTRYSLLCDLTHGDVQVFLRRRFEQPKTLHLADELKKGRHELDLDQWLGEPKPEPLSPPPVIARSTRSAAEVLQRALAARGGPDAAAKIHSIRAKGTVQLVDAPSYAALSIEYVAIRPNRFRTATDIVASTGPNLGQYVEGFDGHIGWNTDTDRACHILRGQEYELRKDDANFFGWCDDSGSNDVSKECIGEVKFAGKLCYDLKIVTPSHHEEHEYYDTTTFLLVGTFSHDVSLGQMSWLKGSYGHYQAFDGFLIPMHIESQDDWGHYPLQFSSLEINTVTNFPAAPIFAQVDPKIFARYAGQYRKSLLFGLLHLGPTLSVSCVTDKILGDHLVASVQGLREFPSGYNAGDFLPVKSDSFVVDPEITDEKIQLTFGRLRNEKATRLMVNWNGKTVTGARISDKPVL